MRLVEDAQHGILAMNRGHHRDADIDVAPPREHPERTILRHAPLGDVELGKHLDARDDALGLFDARHLRNIDQHAVNAKFNGESAWCRFPVNVASALLHRVIQGRVDDAHHRALVFADARKINHLGTRACIDLAGRCFAGDNVECTCGFFELGKIGHQIGACGQREAQRPARRRQQVCDALACLTLQPAHEHSIKRIRQHPDQITLNIAHQRRAAIEAFSQRDAIKRRRVLEQISGFEAGVAKPRGQRAHHLPRAHAADALQCGEQRDAAFECLGLCLPNLNVCQRGSGRKVNSGVHDAFYRRQCRRCGRDGVRGRGSLDPCHSIRRAVQPKSSTIRRVLRHKPLRPDSAKTRFHQTCQGTGLIVNAIQTIDGHTG